MSCNPDKALVLAGTTVSSPLLRRGLAVFRRDFGLAETVTFLGQGTLALACSFMETNNWLSAACGEGGEYVLFFGTLILHGLLKSEGSFREVCLKVFSLGPAETVDFWLRPTILTGVTIAVSVLSISEKYSGPIIILVGKILADIPFYTMYYRSRRRTESVIASLSNFQFSKFLPQH